MTIDKLPGWVLLGFLSLPCAADVGLLPLGPEIQVNPEHPHYQQGPAVGLALDGTGIVLWTGDDYAGKRSRILNAKGLPIGPQTSVNPPPDIYASSDQAAAVSPSGAGVTCWPNFGPCWCRLMDTRGALGTDAFRCSSRELDLLDWELGPRVAIAADGSFVVVWILFYDPELDGYYQTAIQGQFFDPSGARAGPVFELARGMPPGKLNDVSVAILSGERAVVTWIWPDADGSGDGILGRIVSRSGEPEGPAFVVNTYTLGFQELVSVASNDQDRFVVVWESEEQDGFAKGIYGQLFDGQGSKIDGEFQVSSDAPTDQSLPRVAMDRLGNFVVAHYSSWESPDESQDTFLRAYRPDGTPRGPQIRANEQILYQQQWAALDLSDAGLLQVAYESWRRTEDDPDYNYDIMTRRFVLACEADSHTLCLGEGGRFQVRAFWRTPAGEDGAGSAMPLSTDTGGFYFFSPGNFELLVKVLDACAINSKYWIFAAGLTDVAVDLIVTDTWSGDVQVFKNPLGQAFEPIQKLDAFASCLTQPPGFEDQATVPPGASVAPAEAEAPVRLADSDAVAAACSEDPAVLCLRGGRFRITASWRDFIGQTGQATALPLSDESGLFYFFSADNLELAVKVLDGCGINDRFWAFAVGLTNVEVSLEVKDTQTGETWRQGTLLGQPFPTALDTGALATCP